MGRIELSIIIPCYNEGIKLIKNIDKINSYLTNKMFNYKYEIIIVNDGSEDNTLEICNSLKNTYKNLKVISYTNNKGKGYAVKQGILNSIGDNVIFMDADLSTDIRAIEECIETLNTYDIVIGSRRHPSSILVRKQGILRQIVGKACSVITNIIIPLSSTDTQCGFKGFKGDVAKELVKKQTLDGFSFDVELLFIGKTLGYTIKDIPVIWENDNDSKVNLLNSSISFFKDLFIIRKNKKLYKSTAY